MSDYEPPQPVIFPPIFNSVNWPPFEDQVAGGGGGGGGAQGPQGYQGGGGGGFQGRQGPQGNQGNAGTNGTSGNQGFQGNQGDVGAQGGVILFTDPIAIGTGAGLTGQQLGSVAIGRDAGNLNQYEGCVAIGYQAGLEYQGSTGANSGQLGAVALGYGAGKFGQQGNAIGIGLGAGESNQAEGAIAIGVSSGSNEQGFGSVAIGRGAGSSRQGNYSVAIGNLAGSGDQSVNSIAISATDTGFSPGATGFYVVPVRDTVIGGGIYGMVYDTNTFEIGYSSTGGGGGLGLLLGENDLPVIYGSVVELGGITGIQGATLNTALSFASGIPTGFFNAKAGSGWALPETLFGSGDYPSCAMNSTGQFQILSPDAISALYLSKDYGKTWAVRPLPGGGMKTASISTTGQYIASIVGNGCAISSDYGTTFTQTLFGLPTVNQNSCVISGDGKIVFVSSGGLGIHRSMDYGQTWTLVQPTPTTYGVNGAIKANATCQYVISGGLGTYSPSPLYYSRDYGQTWTTLTTNADFAVGASFSLTGQVQILQYLDRNTGINYNIQSSDYGINFTNLATIPGGAISMNSTGQYCAYVGNAPGYMEIYYSNDYAQSWTMIYSDPIRACFQLGIDGSGQYINGSTRLTAFGGGYTPGIAGITEVDLSVCRQSQSNIVLNATDSCFYLGGTGGATGFYVKPLQYGPTGSQILSYNNTSGEIFYTPRSYFAEYFSTADQPNSGATGNTITYNSTTVQSGISLVATSQITISQTGYYSLAYSLQFINANTAEQYIDIWVEKNGSPLANTNGEYGINRFQAGTNGKLIASSTLFLDAVPNDYFQMRWACSTTDVDLEAVPAGAFVPASPSAIVNIQLISS